MKMKLSAGQPDGPGFEDGKSPGRNVRCIVSVNTLSEGWDCPNVTHIVGYRKFDSQLLTEQVIGRALRRKDYSNRYPTRQRKTGVITNRYRAEYATVVGVPMKGTFPRGGGGEGIPPKPDGIDIYPVPDRREERRLYVPDFISYEGRREGLEVRLAPERVKPYRKTAPEGDAATAARVLTETRGALGEKRVIRGTFQGGAVWEAARMLMRRVGAERGEDQQKKGDRQTDGSLFAQCLKAVRDWIAHDQVEIPEVWLRDSDRATELATQVRKAIVEQNGETAWRGIPRNREGLFGRAGDWEEFHTTKEIRINDAQKSELNAAVFDSGLEKEIAEALASDDRIESWLRNHGRNQFVIPYYDRNRWRGYIPDLFARTALEPTDAAAGAPQVIALHLVIEGKGRQDEPAKKKKAWTRKYWLPAAERAMNEERPYGRNIACAWGFVEIHEDDVGGPAGRIREALAELRTRITRYGLTGTRH